MPGRQGKKRNESQINLLPIPGNLCRVGLRLWREFVFPSTGAEFAVSYQDAKLHSGNTYRFDGWQRVGFSHSGSDRRTGRKGRDKFIWRWPPAKT